MRLFRVLTVLGMTAVLAATTASADAAKKTRHHTVRGTVVAVHHDKKNKHHGYIVVKVHHHKKGQTVAQGSVKEEKIHVGKGTTFVLVGGGKNGTGTHAGFGSLHRGEHVVITTRPGHPHEAERVAVAAHKKGKKTVAAE
jgi:hypothetical protein